MPARLGSGVTAPAIRERIGSRLPTVGVTRSSPPPKIPHPESPSASATSAANFVSPRGLNVVTILLSIIEPPLAWAHRFPAAFPPALRPHQPLRRIRATQPSAAHGIGDSAEPSHPPPVA